MDNIATLLGPILEVMTWVGFVLGLPLLAGGWISERRRCQWAETTGKVISAGGFTGYSWTDHPDADHRSLLPTAESHGLVVGSDVDLYYDVCHPSRWGLTPPRHDNAAWILGWILTGVGIICTVGGFVLLLF
ncbi:MAG: hypothetical protein ABWX69_01645 [Arthrobacter sp.]